MDAIAEDLARIQHVEQIERGLERAYLIDGGAVFGP